MSVYTNDQGKEWQKKQTEKNEWTYNRMNIIEWSVTSPEATVCNKLHSTVLMQNKGNEKKCTLALIFISVMVKPMHSRKSRAIL